MSSRSSHNKQQQEILNKIPIFLAKTFRIVNNPAYSDTIEWNAEGDAFIIKNVAKLTNEIFPQHFKHNNFLSFVRQLNMYGFHKIVSTTETEGQVFKHQCFRRDATDSFLLIKRKNTGEQPENQQIVAIPGRQQKLQKQVSLLRSQHQELQSMMEILIQQNKTITAQNKAFAHMMSQMRQKYRKKLQTLMLLFLFGKKNHTNDFIFPPQFSNIIEAFQQMNRNGNSVIMLPQKKNRKRNNFPMITNNEQSIFHSDGQRSEVHSQFDKDQREDIFKVLNHYKSPRRSRSHSHKDEQQKSQKHSENEWKQGIPISPLSIKSRPQRVHHPTEWDDYLNRLQHSDCSELNLQQQQ